MNPFETYIPPNFGTLNGYLFIDNAAKAIEFYKHAFYAKEVSRTTDEETGVIRNVILQIGNSGYSVFDVDMNGQTQNADINMIRQNIGKGEQF